MTQTTSQNNTGRRWPTGKLVRKYGRPVRTRTADLYRVNSEVQKLKPFACLAFPFLTGSKNAPKMTEFLVTNW